MVGANEPADKRPYHMPEGMMLGPTTPVASSGGGHISAITFQNVNKRLYGVLRPGAKNGTAPVDMLISHMEQTSTIHGIAEHGCTMAEISKLRERLEEKGMVLHALPAKRAGYGGVALVFRKSEWGHRFLDVHEFPECGNRLLLCRFRRGKEQTAGILYVWVVYSPTLTTTSTKMAKGGRKPPTEPMVAALVKRIREEIRGHVASSREQQMHSLEVILTDGNSVVDPAKDRYTYPVGKCRITTGWDKDRQGRVMAVHAMKEKITVQMDHHTAEQSYKVSRRWVQCLHEQTGCQLGSTRDAPRTRR